MCPGKACPSATPPEFSERLILSLKDTAPNPFFQPTFSNRIVRTLVGAIQDDPDGESPGNSVFGNGGREIFVSS